MLSFIKGLTLALSPIVFALFVSVCMENVIGPFTKKGFSRHKVTIISYGLLLLIVAGAIALITPLFIKQLKVFMDTLPALFSEVGAFLTKFNINFKTENLVSNLQIKLDNIINYFSNIINVFISIGIAFSAAFYISYDYEKIKVIFKKFIPSMISNEVNFFFSKYFPFFAKYIRSLLIDSIITFSISLVLFILFKVDYFLVGALIITITNLIPFIGTLLAIVPLVVIGYSVSSYFAIISLVIVLFVQLVESNFIQPLVFKNVIKLHPIEEMSGVLISSYLFGTIGMIFSPLLVVAFKILFVEKYHPDEVTF